MRPGRSAGRGSSQPSTPGVERVVDLGLHERAVIRWPNCWPAFGCDDSWSDAPASGLGIVVGLLAVQHAVVELTVAVARRGQEADRQSGCLGSHAAYGPEVDCGAHKLRLFC